MTPSKRFFRQKNDVFRKSVKFSKFFAFFRKKPHFLAKKGVLEAF